MSWELAPAGSCGLWRQSSECTFGSAALRIHVGGERVRGASDGLALYV
jgi:hypothetical protein